MPIDLAKTLQNIGQQLKQQKIPQPFQEAEQILAFIYQLSWNDFLIQFLKKSLPALTASQQAKLKNLLKKRLAHWPLAYLTGQKYFSERPFTTQAKVFIPRSDSERLIDIIKEDWKKTSKKPKIIADLGTGSGALAITLAKELEPVNQQSKIIGVDISKKAIILAKKNSCRLKAKVKFFQSNLLSRVLTKQPTWLIANLPYLSTKDLPKQFLKSDQVLSLKFEPQAALFAEPDGLQAFRRLFAQIKKTDQPVKKIYLEFHPPSLNLLKKTIKNYFPKARLEVQADYAGKKRFLTINL